MGRVRLYRTEAIVLGRRDFGEADRILTLLTADRGKLVAIAKGVRRLTSRLGGHVEPFTHASLLLAEGRNMDLVTQAETVQPNAGLRDDLVRTTYAYHVAETTDRFIREGEPCAEAFVLLRDTLSWLAEADDPALAARYYELHLLDALGYRPQLTECAACGVSVSPGGNSLSPEAGGVLCPSCATLAPDRLELDQTEFRVLRFLQAQSPSVIQRVSLAAETRERLETVMGALLRHYLESDLRSVRYLQRLRGTGALEGPASAAAGGLPTAGRD